MSIAQLGKKGEEDGQSVNRVTPDANPHTKKEEEIIIRVIRNIINSL